MIRCPKHIRQPRLESIGSQRLISLDQVINGVTVLQKGSPLNWTCPNPSRPPRNQSWWETWQLLPSKRSFLEGSKGEIPALPEIMAGMEEFGGMEPLDSGGSDGKESACDVGDPGSIPGLGRSLEEGMATHSSILAWRIPWTRAWLQSMGPQRVGQDWVTLTVTAAVHYTGS